MLKTTYLRNCVCVRGGLSAFPFTSFCGSHCGLLPAHLAGHQVSLELTVRPPETLAIHSPGLPPPMGANLRMCCISTQLSALGFVFTQCSIYLVTIIFLPLTGSAGAFSAWKRSDAVSGRRSLSELAVLYAKWCST